MKAKELGSIFLVTIYTGILDGGYGVFLREAVAEVRMYWGSKVSMQEADQLRKKV